MNSKDLRKMEDRSLFERTLLESPIGDESPRWEQQTSGVIRIPDDVTIVAMWKKQDGGNGKLYPVTRGTIITDVKRTHGFGSPKINGKKMKIETGVLETLIKNHSGSEDEWFKAKGNGYVDMEMESGRIRPYAAEFHWYKRNGVGAVDLKIKEWGHYLEERGSGRGPVTSQYILMEDGIKDSRSGNTITDSHLVEVAKKCRDLILSEDYEGFTKYLNKSRKRLTTDQIRILTSTWITEKGDEIFGILDSIQQ